MSGHVQLPVGVLAECGCAASVNGGHELTDKGKAYLLRFARTYKLSPRLSRLSPAERTLFVVSCLAWAKEGVEPNEEEKALCVRAARRRTRDPWCRVGDCA